MPKKDTRNYGKFHLRFADGGEVERPKYRGPELNPYTDFPIEQDDPYNPERTAHINNTDVEEIEENWRRLQVKPENRRTGK